MIKLSLPNSVIGEMYVHDHEGSAADIVGNHEMTIVNYLLNSLQSNSNFVDLGAYQGYFTLIASQIIKTGTIYSFEPCIGSFEIVQKNIELHNLTNVKAYNMAMSYGDGTTVLQWRDGAQCISRIFDILSDNNAYNLESIPCTCLDNFFENETIDFIKVDIEGAEVELFKGAMKFFDRNKQCKVLLELHSMNIKNRNVDHNEFIHSLLDRFDFYNYDPSAPDMMTKCHVSTIEGLYLPSYNGGYFILVPK